MTGCEGYLAWTLAADGMAYVPAVRMLTLRNVGPWVQAVFEFSPHLNIITGDCGTGKSTVLRAIAGAASNTVPANLAWGERSRIEVELAERNLALAWDERTALPTKPLHPRNDVRSAGERVLSELTDFAKQARPGHAMLIDSEVTGQLTSGQFVEATDLIRAATGQKIVVVTCRSAEFPNARVFECSRDRIKAFAGVTVRDV